MNRDRVMRRTLQVTCLFNFAGAFALAFPASSLGQLFGLPADAPAVYRAFASGAIALFGLAYGWLSVQRVIDRPLVVLSICGKFFAFSSLLLLAVIGQLPIRAPLLGVADLVFALIFLWWWFDV